MVVFGKNWSWWSMRLYFIRKKHFSTSCSSFLFKFLNILWLGSQELNLFTVSQTTALGCSRGAVFISVLRDHTSPSPSYVLYQTSTSKLLPPCLHPWNEVSFWFSHCLLHVSFVFILTRKEKAAFVFISS